MTTRRAVLIVLDGVGAGHAPDAAAYGDAGSDTLGNLHRAVPLKMPNLRRLGLELVADIGRTPGASLEGSCAILQEISAGKDTLTGHWEMMCLPLEKPFPTYPDGFPAEIIAEFEKLVGRPVIGNLAASGTEIIERLGEEHLGAGALIVYTSADSVFQVAAHDSVLSEEELYEVCRLARGMLVPPHGVARVIARPFTGRPGSFMRTDGRKDYPVPPFGETALDALQAAGVPVHAVGKIADIFCGRGITSSLPTHGNAEGVERLLEWLAAGAEGLAFANLIDFDMLYGHRNDEAGFAGALEAFDAALPSLLGRLAAGDVLMVTADHGCDPTTASTDHSREMVPLLLCGPGIPARALGKRTGFMGIGRTLLSWFGVESGLPGESLLPD